MPSDDRSPVEQLLERTSDPAPEDRRLSDRARQAQRSLEAYLRSGSPPRWMQRIAEIEQGIRRERRRLAEAHRTLAARHAGDPEGFARHWREVAASWSFDELNVLIDQHNEWFPIERQLPVDPRTRDYVRIHGRSYRRRRLDADWVLEEFPPVLPDQGQD
jgi:hypothetical protein